MVDGEISNKKITRFEDLVAWQEAQKLAVLVHKLTDTFPGHEQFGLTSQIRRAAVSVSANIAEGFGRSTVQDKLHFYTMSYGSLLETKNFAYLASRLDYIDQRSLDSMLAQALSCQKILNALKRSLKKL
jgi:four helix bundle protein